MADIASEAGEQFNNDAFDSELHEQEGWLDMSCFGKTVRPKSVAVECWWKRLVSLSHSQPCGG
jgi:hypothetical protein